MKRAFYHSYSFIYHDGKSLKDDRTIDVRSSVTEMTSATKIPPFSESMNTQSSGEKRQIPKTAKWKKGRSQFAPKKTKSKEAVPTSKLLGLDYPPDHIDQNRVNFLQQVLNPAMQSALRSFCSHDACTSELSKYHNLTRRWEAEPLERFATAQELAKLRSTAGKNSEGLRRRLKRQWTLRGEEAERASLSARGQYAGRLVHWTAGLAACDGCAVETSRAGFSVRPGEKALLRRFVGGEEKEPFSRFGESDRTDFSVTGIIVTT